ncbi:MAG: response regulator [Terriglobia bacterium]
MARIVLVADDSPTIQKKALGILKGEGFEVETVSNGVAAIKRLAALQPVVILADVSMPGRDGYEVCEFVKKSAEHSHVPVLLVASDMEPYDEARGAQVRADGIIKKPFDPQELISLVVKFAEQCEMAAPTASLPAVAPAAPEPTPEFAISDESPEEPPAVVQPAAPDFSAVSEGVAFAEAVGEETPQYSAEPQPAEMEAASVAPEMDPGLIQEPPAAPEVAETAPAPEPPSAPAAETPLVEEEPPAPPARARSFFEGLEAATPEPVFIEEQPAQSAEPPSDAAEVRTMIFRAPLQIAEPVWKDETVPAPPAPEPAGPTGLEPQLVAEAPAALPETPAAPEPAGPTGLEPQLDAEAPITPPETPAEQPAEHAHFAPSVTATSLDSFSLDDATAGQVHFASEAVEAASVEVAPSAPVEEAPATEMAPPEPAPEATPPEPPAEYAPPPPAYDWNLIYAVVHKVVVKMSPPALPMEAVEEMARRLADEIAMEISSELSPPPA